MLARDRHSRPLVRTPVSSGALHYLLNITSGRDVVWRNDCEQRNDVYIYGSMMIVLRVEDSKPNRRRKHGCVKCW